MTKPGSAWPDSVGLWPCTGTAVLGAAAEVPGAKQVPGTDAELPGTGAQVPRVNLEAPGTKEVLGADVEVPRTDTEVPAEGVAIAGARDGGILDERRIRHSGFLSAPY